MPLVRCRSGLGRLVLQVAHQVSPGPDPCLGTLHSPILSRRAQPRRRRSPCLAAPEDRVRYFLMGAAPRQAAVAEPTPPPRPSTLGTSSQAPDRAWEDRSSAPSVIRSCPPYAVWDPSKLATFCKLPLGQEGSLLACVVTNCVAEPETLEPIRDQARFPWHEVKKVQHYCLNVDALKRSLGPRQPHGCPQ